MTINSQLVWRFIVHVMLIALGATVMYLEQWVTQQNFGSYQVVAMAVNTIVFTAIEKFFTDQGVPLPTAPSVDSTTAS